MRRIMDPGQPGKKLARPPSQSIIQVGGSQSEASPGKKHETLSEKCVKCKKAGSMAQVVGYYLASVKP
jgi:hypothetical protein